MPEIESDPSQSTEMFRAFVERGAAGQPAADTPRRRVPAAAIAAIVVLVVVLAAAAFLLL
jgi:hypothetical protein